MLAYVDVQSYLETQLTGLGYDPLPLFEPGPATNIITQDLSPGMMVIISIGSGPGYDMEKVFDRVMVQIRAIGNQQDYTSAESLAYDIDRQMGDLNGPTATRWINGKRILEINRAGGAPTLLLLDDAERHHFTCNYVWEVVY